MQLGRVALFLCLQVDKLIYVKTGRQNNKLRQQGRIVGKITGQNYSGAKKERIG